MKINVFRLKPVYVLLPASIAIMALLPVVEVGWYYLHVIFLFFIYLTLAEMWNLLAGFSGLVSLGQVAFMGLGGYMIGISLFYDVPLFLGAILGCILATVFAAVISAPVFRLRGFYFAIGTLIIPEALRIWFNSWKPAEAAEVAVGGGAGFAIRGGPSPVGLYYLALIVGFVSILLMRFILSSKLGAGLVAIRDNEDAAASYGINVFRCKFYSFLIAAFVTAMAGCAFYLYQGHLEPVGTFSIDWLMIMIIAVVIGGIGTEEGPVIGAAIVVLLDQVLAGYGQFSPLILGLLLIIVIVIMPKGIMGTVRETQAYTLLLKYLET